MPRIRDKSKVSKPLETPARPKPSNTIQLRTLAIKTKYWRPGTDYIAETVKAVQKRVLDDDFIVVSEKAISTAMNNIIDESTVTAGLGPRLIARFWMRKMWGQFLGHLCRLQPRLLSELQTYPIESGSRHKQLALQHGGLLQALMFGSEAGIDGSNLPYSYVSLPLKKAEESAEKIRLQIEASSGKKVSVMIVDTDKTYSFRNFHFTPRPNPLKGIHSIGGFLAYTAGRFLRLKKRATPLTATGCILTAEKALRVAETANRARGYGAGRTVWDMAEYFKVSLENVTWEMLETARHKPIVIVRKKR
jgi:F420-0:gamma-glutamyl ligase-like protein